MDRDDVRTEESTGGRRGETNGAEDERSEDESGVDKGSMEGAEKVGEFLYRSDGPNRPKGRDRGRFVASDEADRFWSRVTVVGECWLWTGRTTTDGAYGRFTDARGREVRAHRWAYERLVGPIPEGHTLDHLIGQGACSSTLCVRAPRHLEPVTNSENLRRRHARRRAQENDR